MMSIMRKASKSGAKLHFLRLRGSVAFSLLSAERLQVQEKKGCQLGQRKMVLISQMIQIQCVAKLRTLTRSL